MEFSSYLYGGVYLLGFLVYLMFPSGKFSNLEKVGFSIFAANGAIIGGRLGYVIFYEFSYYLECPLEIIQIWKGGMSFHGGVIGLVLGCYIFNQLCRLPKYYFMFAVDRACIVALFIIPLGRYCNFINGELWGRVTELPIGVIFEGADNNPRHPVQLYEAFCEGPLLALAMYVFYRLRLLQSALSVSCLYLAGYCFFRFFTEFFREPDLMVGYIYGLTLGQYLCLFGGLTGILVYKFGLGSRKIFY